MSRPESLPWCKHLAKPVRGIEVCVPACASSLSRLQDRPDFVSTSVGVLFQDDDVEGAQLPRGDGGCRLCIVREVIRVLLPGSVLRARGPP